MSNNLFYNDIAALHQEVTGSCIMNIIKFPDGSTKKILVDCGLFQEGDTSQKLNKILPFDASSIDYVLVTHNHVDHTGRLPLLVKNGYHGDIHVSCTTSKLLPYALGDSYKVLKTRAKIYSEPQLYSNDDVEQTIRQIKDHPYNESFYLDENKNIKVTFFMNGHLPGAVVILIQIKYHNNNSRHYEDINLLYTGDYNSRNMFFDVDPIPNWVKKLPLTIVQESTYGNMDSMDVKYVFKDNILNALKDGKEIVLPVFSLGRAQEILFTFKKWQDEGILNKSIPIYFDGKLGMDYTNIYLKDGLDNREDCRDFIPENFINISGNSELRRNITEDHEQKIIIATGGMGSHGPAQTYIPSFLKRSNALIHFTGYCAEGTVGRKIHDANYEDIVEVAGLQVQKLAQVEYTSEFSAHAKADELVYFLNQFESKKLVLINHGDSKVKSLYANRVVKETTSKDVGILGTYLFRVDSYGLIKSFTTKFSR